MAVGNILGYATGSYSGWYNIFWFPRASACNVSCANLKSAFFLDIGFIAITTYISIAAANEVTLSSSVTAHDEEEAAESGWFPFLLFDTDWMGREIYGGEPNEGSNYDSGVRMGALGLMLNSVILGVISLLMERLCRKRGAGFVWGISNIIMAVCILAMLVVTYVAKNIGYLGKDLPPVGIVIAALIVFSVLGFPLSITYSVPYALISSHIESLGLGQGLSMGVLNLAIVVPQVLLLF